MSRALILVILAGFFAGCASSEKAISPAASPSHSVGYVGGNFVLGKPTFPSALLLVNQATSAEYILSFSNAAEFKAGHTETSLIALPPGTYRVTHWIVYNAFWGPGAGGREGKKEIPRGRLSEAFVVNGDEVVFLGKFFAEYGPSPLFMGYSGGWKIEPISNQEARDLLKSTYPNFSSTKLTCMTCRP